MGIVVFISVRHLHLSCLSRNLHRVLQLQTDIMCDLTPWTDIPFPNLILIKLHHFKKSLHNTSLGVHHIPRVLPHTRMCSEQVNKFMGWTFPLGHVFLQEMCRYTPFQVRHALSLTHRLDREPPSEGNSGDVGLQHSPF